LSFIKLYLDSGVNINEIDSEGDTALMKAVKYHCGLPVVKFLVEHGADINLKNNNGESVSFYIAQYGNLDSLAILEYLCKEGLDVNTANKAGKYPFVESIYAIYAFTKILIQYGIQYIPGDSHELFIKAIQNNDCIMVSHLLKHGAKTEWQESRQGEDEWGRYSTFDKFDMYEFAKAKKAHEIVRLLEAFNTSK
jgi:ankyrin repeat protein